MDANTSRAGSEHAKLRAYEATVLDRSRCRSPNARLPRRGVGGSTPRRPGPVREARTRRLSGRSLLARHSAQARALPRGLRRLRSGAHGALRSQEDRPAPQGFRHRPQPPEGPGGGRECPLLSRVPGPGGTVRHVSLELRRRLAQTEPPTRPAGVAGANARIGRHERGPGGAWLPLRRPHHLLRVHAGRGHGERSPRDLLPSPRASAAGATDGRPLDPPWGRSAAADAPWWPARRRTRDGSMCLRSRGARRTTARPAAPAPAPLAPSRAGWPAPAPGPRHPPPPRGPPAAATPARPPPRLPHWHRHVRTAAPPRGTRKPPAPPGVPGYPHVTVPM